MLCQRFSGSLRRQRAIKRSISEGTPPVRVAMFVGSSRRIAESVDTSEPPSNARRPVTIS